MFKLNSYNTNSRLNCVSLKINLYDINLLFYDLLII